MSDDDEDIGDDFFCRFLKILLVVVVKEDEEEADEADEEAESTLLLVDEVLKWTSLKGGGLNVVVLLQERCSCNDNTGENHWAPLAETGYGKKATLALMEHLSRYFEIRAWGYGQVL